MANFTSNVVDAAIAPFTPAPKPPPMPSASASAANIAAEAKVNRRLRRSVIRTKAPPNPTGDAYNPDHVVLSRMDPENEMEAVPPSPQMERSLLPAATPADPDPALASQSVKRMSKFVDPRNIKPSLFGAFSLSSADEQAESRRRRASVLAHAFTPMELEFYENNPGCAVLATANRVIRSVSTRQRAGGLSVPPPIVSRVFQELSNGLLAYNSALKMKEVPVPFAFVYCNTLMLHFFIFIAPAAVGIFSSSSSNTYWTSVLAFVLSFFINSTFTAMWLVANELEDPFGIEPNDIPMMSFHNEFCCNLQGLLLSPWMMRDEWVVKAGEWKRPQPMASPPATETSSAPPASASRMSKRDEASARIRFKGETQGSLKHAAAASRCASPTAKKSTLSNFKSTLSNFRSSKQIVSGKETHDVVSLRDSLKTKASKLEENRMITSAVTSQMLCFPNPDDEQFRCASFAPTLDTTFSTGLSTVSQPAPAGVQPVPPLSIDAPPTPAGGHVSDV